MNPTTTSVPRRCDAHEPARLEPDRAQRDDELKAKVQSTIRVRTAQVDDLLNVISEVVIAQIKDEQRISDLKSMQGSADDAWMSWQRMRSMLTTLGGEAIAETLGEDLSALDAISRATASRPPRW